MKITLHSYILTLDRIIYVNYISWDHPQHCWKCLHIVRLQYCGHLMQRANSLEKTLMLGKIEDRRRRGQQRIKRLDGKAFVYNAGDLGLIPGLGRSTGGRHGNPLQYSCLENPHGQRNLASYSPWGCKESDMTEWLSTHIQEARWRGSSRVH